MAIMKLKVLNNLIITCLAFAFSLPLWGQGTVSTRKYRFSDFPDKVTQVVLTGNEVLSDALRQEVVGGWTVSAFELCTLEQFEARKTSADYYFLMAAETRFKGEENPGIVSLSLVKGGPEAAEGIGAMDEVLSLPLCAAEGSSGRELVYLGPLVRAMQDFVRAAVESERSAYLKERWFNLLYDKQAHMMQMVFAQDDLADPAAVGKYLDADCRVADSAEADQLFLDGQYNTLVSYTVAPLVPELNASYSYQLLFEASSHQLYYVGKHKITPTKGAGFLPEDLKRLARKR